MGFLSRYNIELYPILECPPTICGRNHGDRVGERVPLNLAVFRFRASPAGAVDASAVFSDAAAFCACPVPARTTAISAGRIGLAGSSRCRQPVGPETPWPAGRVIRTAD